MKCQNLFSMGGWGGVGLTGKKEKYFKMSSAEFFYQHTKKEVFLALHDPIYEKQLLL